MSPLRPAASLVTAMLAAACADRPANPPVSSQHAVFEYDVRVSEALDLDVAATLVGPIDGPLIVDAARYLDGFELETRAGPEPSSLADPRLGEACARRCRLHYGVRLAEAAASLQDVDIAWASGGAIFSPLSAWLLRPSHLERRGRYRLRVATPSGIEFVTGLRPAADAYEGRLADLHESTFAALGSLRVARVTPEVVVAESRGVPLPDEVIDRWIRAEVEAIARYFGRAPTNRLALFVTPGTSEATRGRTLAAGGPSVLVRLGTAVDAKSLLMDDWVLAHELVHVTFPSVGYAHPWFSEGLATYVEPVARVRAGLLSREDYWRELIEGLPQGLPGAGDEGLEGSSAWGRTYWGGALFFFLADLRIRTQTSDERSLDDALRAVVASGDGVESHWPIDRVIRVGDRGTGTTVLEDLYGELGLAPGSADLPALWTQLGIHLDDRSVRLDDEAPLAQIRENITGARHAP